MTSAPPFPSPSETPRGERAVETSREPGAHDLADNLIPLEIPPGRLDISPDGKNVIETTTPKGTGPRQRRFDFDAPVIRDSIVLKLRAIGRDDIAEPLDNCHREPTYQKCNDCGTVRKFWNRCEKFCCPICAGRLARERRETVQFWTNVTNQPKHLILTVKSVPVLTKSYVRQLKDDFRKLRNQKWAKHGELVWTSTAIKPHAPHEEPIPGRTRKRHKLSPWSGQRRFKKHCKWRGGFWSLDVTWNPKTYVGDVRKINGRDVTFTRASDGGWHVHFHVIVDCDFIDKERLEREWSKIRGQEIAISWIEDVKGKDYVAEACKYACDGISIGNWPAEMIAQFCDALTDERCFDTFGCLYKQRAEWTNKKAEIYADKNVCPCGCKSFTYHSDSEWEWAQIKSSLAPPPGEQRPTVLSHPELFAPSAGRRITYGVV